MHQDCTAPEEWRPVVGYEAYYDVSSWGRVRRKLANRGTRTGRILKPQWTQRNGLPERHTVSLSIEGRRMSKMVHSLVANAFLGPRPEGHEVNHIDGDRMNNHADNLEWATPVDNRDHAVAHNLISHGSRHWRSRLTEDQVRMIRARYRAGGISQAALAAEYQVHQSAISLVITEKNWRHVS